MEYKKNSEIELEIVDITEKGMGIAKKDSIVFFVENATIGDFVIAKILKVTKNIIYAKTIEFIKLSEYREKHSEEVHKKCGNCTLFLLKYQKQIEYKINKVKNNFSKIAKIEIDINSIVESVEKTHYRNKTIYPLSLKDNKIIYGSYKISSHNLIENRYCLIQNKKIDDLMFEITKLLNKYKISIYNENTHKGFLRNIFFRISEYTDEIQVGFIVKNKNIDKNFIDEIKKINGIKSIFLNINSKKTNTILSNDTHFLYGKDYIEEKIGDLIYRIHPNSFFQVNIKTCKKLYDKILEVAEFKKEERVLDLFCGVGSISLYISKYVKEVKGVEIIEFATKFAEINREINKISNVSFVTEDANKILEDLNNYQTLIVDPPRKGLEKNLIDSILNSKINKIIYVSCDSATLARDISYLKEKFKVSSISLVDMFAQTNHVECVVLMTRVAPTK